MVTSSASQNRAALSTMTSNTGRNSAGEALMIFKTSAAALCCSSASSRSRVRMPTCFCRSATDGAAIDTLRALGLFACRPLTGCSLPPRCRISPPSGGSRRGSSLSKSWGLCHGKCGFVTLCPLFSQRRHPARALACGPIADLALGAAQQTRWPCCLIRRRLWVGLQAMVQERPVRVERKLSAILAADVAGYSRLMHDDEESTHAKLSVLLADAVNPAIAVHGGRIVKNTGDGFLA